MAKDWLDRLGDLFDSLYDTVRGARDSGDPDFDQAWQELDTWLNQDHSGRATNELEHEFERFDKRFKNISGKDAGSESRGSSQSHKTQDQALEELARELVRDYHNLEIKPGSKLEEVKAAYKRMLKTYHPDKFASDPKKYETATAITSKLNASYARILKHLGTRS